MRRWTNEHVKLRRLRAADTTSMCCNSLNMNLPWRREKKIWSNDVRRRRTRAIEGANALTKFYSNFSIALKVLRRHFGTPIHLAAREKCHAYWVINGAQARRSSGANVDVATWWKWSNGISTLRRFLVYFHLFFFSFSLVDSTPARPAMASSVHTSHNQIFFFFFIWHFFMYFVDCVYGCMSFDGRVVDGIVALAAMSKYLESVETRWCCYV